MPIHPDRRVQDGGESHTLSRRLCRDQPDTRSHEGQSVRRAEVLLDDEGHAQVAEGPGADVEIQAPMAVEVLEGNADGADSPKGDADPHPVSGARTLRSGGRREREPEDECEGSGGQWADRAASDEGHVRRSIDNRAGAVHGVGIGSVPRARCGRGARVALVAAFAFAACAPPDTPPELRALVPDAVVELLRPDTVRGGRIAGGVWYRYLWSATGPWAVHVVEADLTRCDLALRTLRAEARESGGRGHERVSSMVARSGGRALVAVNADFFTPEGTAVGSEVVAGRVTSARARPIVAWRPGAPPWMGSAAVRDDSLRVGWAVALRSGDGLTQAVGGFPELLDGGHRVGDLGVADRPAFAASRHPRTAVAWDPDRSLLLLVVVDGRQAPYSVGMTLPELAGLLEAWGAREAINLDGGGSSVMVVLGTARNHPSDGAGERPVVNALALVREAEGCRAAPPSPARNRP